MVSSTVTWRVPAAAPPLRSRTDEPALRGERHDAAGALDVARRDDELEAGVARAELGVDVEERAPPRPRASTPP